MMPRRTIEWMLRGAALLALVLLAWRQLPRDPGAARAAVTGLAWRGAPARSGDTTGDRTTDGDARRAVDMLIPHVVRETPAPLHIAMHAIPSVATRGVAASIPASGLVLAWTDSTGARGLAIDAAPTIDPDGRVLLSASARDGTPLALRDAGGVLDSAAMDGPVASLLVRRTAAATEARIGASRAFVAPPVAVPTRRILLVGRPGWEAKFTIAALEESGWTVDASLPVAPRAAVTVGVPLAPDTARYAVVIVLDSGLARAPALARYAQAGGGVVLSGDALLDRSLVALVPARIGATRAEVPGGLLSPSPGSGLEAVRLAALPAAVVLARDFDGSPATVAARRGSGRVVASGYRQTWRWRMEGAADGVDAHRSWWTGLVRAAGYAPAASADSADRAVADAMSDVAPFADLVARLGAPSPAPAAALTRGAASPPGTDRRLDTALLVGAFAALLAEWASRRLRGAR